MNSPAHAVFNLLVLGRRGRPDAVPWIAAGAVLPDAPAVVFYAWEKGVLARPEGLIWSRDYFAPGWQAVFDSVHSFPVLAAALLLAVALGLHRVAYLVGSMGLHALADLPLHRHDAHHHFFPLSSWRFESPVSYWEPDHFGQIAGLFELALVAVGTVVLWRRFPNRLGRGIVAAAAAVYGFYLAYVVLVWM